MAPSGARAVTEIVIQIRSDSWTLDPINPPPGPRVRAVPTSSVVMRLKMTWFGWGKTGVIISMRFGCW
ncbi:uncharacterized protein CTRU02_210068 [Colletotrichum truncatum]|uniref:Uncharacterized protein n=1 Tax=Colletotrichum truncatum TaxID=5467 RepID=A0ACC3YWG0_COLTU